MDVLLPGHGDQEAVFMHTHSNQMSGCFSKGETWRTRMTALALTEEHGVTGGAEAGGEVQFPPVTQRHPLHAPEGEQGSGEETA